MKNSQKGSIFLILIFVVIIVFSLSMVSGAAKFQYSPEPPSLIGNNPTATPSATTSPSPSPITSPSPTENQWSISYTISSCENGIARINVVGTGTSNGYATVELQNQSREYIVQLSNEFIAPSGTTELILRSVDGYGATPWRLVLFEGGTGAKDIFSGGIQRAIHNGQPTGC